MSDNVIILAAGEGTRLRPITNNLPKGMVPFFEKPLISWQIEVIRSAKINDIAIVGGYKRDKLSKLDCKIIENSEYAVTNMVWSLYKARHLIKRNTIIAYGDILYHPDALYQLQQTQGAICVSIDINWRAYWECRSSEPILDAESLQIDSHGQISQIGQKVVSLSDPQGQFMGLIKFGGEGATFLQQLFLRYEKGETLDIDLRQCYMTDLLQYAIDEGVTLLPAPNDEPWVEVDTIADYHWMETSLRLKNIINVLK